MNKIKQLNEDLGDLRKKMNELTNTRASKLTELRALAGKDSLSEEEQESFNTIKNEIEAIDSKMSINNEQIDLLKDQIANERLHGDQAGDQFRFEDAGDGPSGEEKEMGKFSLTKAIRDSLQGGQPQGLEAEIVAEGRKEMAQAGQNAEGNIILPSKLMAMGSPHNALTATGGTAGSQGGATIQADVLSMIDILRSKLPFVDSSQGAGLGATLWTGLTGNVTFPKAEEDESELTERTENQEAEEQSPTFSARTLSPKRRASFADISRQLILQSNESIENWLRNYLMYKLAKSMNINIISYLLDLAGTHAVENGDDGGALDWAKIVAFETGISVADAEEEERFAWLTNAKVRGKLKTTRKGENDSGVYLWNESNEVNNAPAFVSNLVPSDLEKGTAEDLSAAIFGNWASLYIGMWGPIDMLANPYTRDTEGIIRLNIWNWMDRMARHPESFAVSKDIDTTL